MNKQGGYQYHFADLNSRIQSKFQIVEEIRKLIYDHSNPNKFVYNSFTKRKQLSPELTMTLLQYNSIKVMVERFAPESTGMVDMTMVKQFLD